MVTTAPLMGAVAFMARETTTAFKQIQVILPVSLFLCQVLQ